jgi:hypothetical protein
MWLHLLHTRSCMVQKDEITANYRQYVVQVMTIAASQVALTDLATRGALIDAATGELHMHGTHT